MLRYSLSICLCSSFYMPYLISIVLPHFRWPNTVCIIKLQFKHSQPSYTHPVVYDDLPIIPLYLISPHLQWSHTFIA
ncbi:hypothetical protein DFS34DRAFT_641036, partial [Phlyctochytrium arcticum]